MFLQPLLFVALVGAAQSSTADNDDPITLIPQLFQKYGRETTRKLLKSAGKRKPGELFKFVVANGQLPSNLAVTKSEKKTDPDIFGPVRARKGGKKSQSFEKAPEKAERRRPGSIFSLFDDGDIPTSTARPPPTPQVFVPTPSGKGYSKSSKSGKKSKSGKGFSSLFSNSPVTSSTTLPTPVGSSRTPAPVPPPTNGPTNTPVSAPPTTILPTDFLFSSPSPTNEVRGKGFGKGSKEKGYQNGKGSKGYKKSKKSSSKKSSGKGKAGMKSKSRGKGKGRSRCDRFEFDIYRRRLQFDGANCGNDFIDVAQHMPQLSSFLELIEDAGLSFMFSCAGPFTIAAPVNSAFEGIDLSTLSRRELRDIVWNHIFPGVILKDDIDDGVLEALNGANIVTTKRPLQLNDARPIQTDIIGCNFVSHTVDALLVDLGPPDICDTVNLGGFQSNECSPNLIDVARNSSDLSLMVDLLKAADLEALLSCGGFFTVLMPDNDAINALGTAAIAQLLNPENKDILRGLLLYHMIGEELSMDDFQEGKIETLLDGGSIVVARPPLQFNNETMVTAGDLNTCNGIIHVIEDVLMPEEPTEQPTEQPTPVPTLGPSPAPSPEPSTFPTVKIVAPTVSPSAAPTFDCSDFNFGGNNANCSPNMLERASNNPQLEIVVRLFEASGLAPLFSCAGPFTALFPVNDAFVALGQDQLQEWLNPANLGDLQRLLLYHVLQGATASSDFSPGPFDTLAPDETVLVVVDPLKFDNAGVISVDDPVCNGLLNVIDTVLDPDFTATATPSGSPSLTPTLAPTAAPTTSTPTIAPTTVSPTIAPTTVSPTIAPTTVSPTILPTVTPTLAPSTRSPTILPTVSPTTSAPTIGPTTLLVTVRVDRFLLAFRSTDNTAPTAQQYQDVKLQTESHYEEVFTNKYLGNDNVMFVGITMNLDFTLEGDDVIDARPGFNIYMEFESAELLFTRSPENPTTQDVYNELTTGITTEYLLNYVRTLAGTPFANVQEGYLEYTIDP